jgi:hypothetical protein
MSVTDRWALGVGLLIALIAIVVLLFWAPWVRLPPCFAPVGTGQGGQVTCPQAQHPGGTVQWVTIWVTG